MTELIDRTLNQLRAANPVSVARIRATSSAEERARARERAIRLADELPESGNRHAGLAGQATILDRLGFGPGRAGGWPSATRTGAAFLGLAVATVAILVGIGSIGGGSGDQPTFAAAAIRVAQANPRLLVTEPGWSVTSADEFKPESGQMTFADGTHELELDWYPARWYHSYYRDRSEVDNTPTMLTLLGQRARMVQYGSRPDFATMLPPQGKVFVEIRGDLGSRQAYLTAIRSLRPVDVDTWLSAMPATVVSPTERAAAVDEMLKGIPLPQGFDASRLRSGGSVLDRYQLGARVTGTVACKWVEQWAQARSDGDAARAAEAVQAMSTARSWPILGEMASQGGWPGAIRSIGANMAAGDKSLPNSVQGPGCKWFWAPPPVRHG